MTMHFGNQRWHSYLQCLLIKLLLGEPVLADIHVFKLPSNHYYFPAILMVYGVYLQSSQSELEDIGQRMMILASFSLFLDTSLWGKSNAHI